MLNNYTGMMAELSYVDSLRRSGFVLRHYCHIHGTGFENWYNLNVVFFVVFWLMRQYQVDSYYLFSQIAEDLRHWHRFDCMPSKVDVKVISEIDLFHTTINYTRARRHNSKDALQLEYLYHMSNRVGTTK